MLAYGQRPNGICTINNMYISAIYGLKKTMNTLEGKGNIQKWKKSMNNSQELSYIQIHNNVIYV